MVKFLKMVIFKTYVIALMIFTVWYGYFMYPLVFGFEGKEQAEESLRELGKAGTEQEIMLVNLIATTGKTQKIDLGYRVIDQPYIEGRFHHIGFEMQRDKVSVCIECHGNVPHDKSKEVRSFLNMHTFYTACETCHIRPVDKKTHWEFRWYDKDTGKLTENPRALVEIDSMFNAENKKYYPTYGNYGAKIAPGRYSGDTFTFIRGEKDRIFVEKFLGEEENLSRQQSSQIKHLIHNKVNKKPIECTDCHQRDNPYIPFAKLGFPPRRVDELTSTAVVGMISKYKEFYIPNFLTPGG